MKEFLEPHEKIRKLRKKYKITQVDLAGDVYTQGYITSLERGVKRITEKNIIDLVDRFNHILVERGINDIVKVDDIQKKKSEVEREYVSTLLVEIKELKDKNKYLEELRNIKIRLNEIAEPHQIQIFQVLSEKASEFMLWEELKEISSFLIMKLEEKASSKEFSNAFLQLTRACAFTADAEYLNPFEENYRIKFHRLDKNLKEEIYTNIINTLSITKHRKKSLFYIEELEKSPFTKKATLNLMLEKAYILDAMGQTQKAKSIYNYIIRKNNRDRDYLIWSKLNLSSILIREDRYEEVKKIFSFLKKEVASSKEEYLSLRYGGVGRIAFYLGKNNDAKKFFELALDSALDNYNFHFEEDYIDFIHKLLQLYKRKDKEKVGNYLKIYNIIKKQSRIIKASFPFMNYYLNNKHYEELKEFIKVYEERI